MNSLSTYITEKLHINKDIKVKEYKYHPKNKDELRSLIKGVIEERGKDADLNDIDTSKITNMYALFEYLDPHNIDISEWDVSNVEDMRLMFYNCEKFNSDLSNWDVSNVKYMMKMFNGCNSLKNKPSWYNE